MSVVSASGASRLLGAILLISGSCIGAGMLALPTLSVVVGLWPSTIACLIAWLVMVTTGLLLLEAYHASGRAVSLVTLARENLGPWGAATTWSTFLFLFYCILVAYISTCGNVTADFLNSLGIDLSASAGSFLFTLLIGLVVFLGTSQVDAVNRFFMFLLFVSYGALFFVGSHHFSAEQLSVSRWSLSPVLVPVLVLSYGFHNLIPTLSNYLKGDVKQMRHAIIWGASLPLAGYLLWNTLILGIVPPQESLVAALADSKMVSQVLRQSIGKAWVADVFSLFEFAAIITSFLGVALSFVDFLADGFRTARNGTFRPLLVLTVLFPPLLFALSYPSVFIRALGYAGGYGAMILFGLLPVLMVWKGRAAGWHVEPQLPGGRTALLLVLVSCCAIIGIQFATEFIR